MKIVVLDGYTLNPGDLSWGELKKLGEVKVYDRTPKDKILERIGNSEIVFTNKTPLDRNVFKKLPNLKYIGVLATGYNVVDIEAAKEFGITVTNVPTYGTMAVAQFTFALILELCHHVWEHNMAVKNGEWSRCADFCFYKYPLIELAGKTLGIIGFGRIGKAVANIALAFGMKVMAYSRNKNSVIESENVRYAEFDELLKNSDIISLHCPLTESNRGMINKDTINKMKDGVILINTARGPLIIEEDLAFALNSRKVAGAAVDVVSIEPINEDNPLLKAKNCIITPHIAWAPKEARERLMKIAVENLKSFLNRSPVNVVNG
ncbi:MAG: D-2-hydroxyacid dehydrogenase [Clostridiaceae bacterium]|nr:D-2-hydroxyacid dehydrogenase [Clostridiaceae bacterium]